MDCPVFVRGPHQSGLQAEDEVQRPHRADGRCRLGVPPRRGRSLTFTQKVPQHHIGGLAGRCAGEGLGRPAVVPPAGRVREWPRPCRGAGGGKVGRFLRKRRGRFGPRGLVPYREVGGRLGEPALRGGCRFGAPGLGANMKLKRLTGESGWQNPTTGWLAYPRSTFPGGGWLRPRGFSATHF